MNGVSSESLGELLQLKLLWILFLILSRIIVDVSSLGALQLDEIILTHSTRVNKFLEPMTRIELVTSPLPWVRSTY